MTQRKMIKEDKPPPPDKKDPIRGKSPSFKEPPDGDGDDPGDDDPDDGDWEDYWDEWWNNVKKRSLTLAARTAPSQAPMKTQRTLTGKLLSLEQYMNLVKAKKQHQRHMTKQKQIRKGSRTQRGDTS